MALDIVWYSASSRASRITYLFSSWKVILPSSCARASSASLRMRSGRPARGGRGPGSARTVCSGSVRTPIPAARCRASGRQFHTPPSVDFGEVVVKGDPERVVLGKAFVAVDQVDPDAVERLSCILREFLSRRMRSPVSGTAMARWQWGVRTPGRRVDERPGSPGCPWLSRSLTRGPGTPRGGSETDSSLGTAAVGLKQALSRKSRAKRATGNEEPPGGTG